jgi:thymidylate synthase ThyX
VWAGHDDTDLWTVEATFARSALSELNTHRAFSRNSASSRAIPVKKMLDKVNNDPFIPRRFSLAQKGMSASEFIDYEKDPSAWSDMAEWWLKCRDRAVEGVQEGLDYGLHKQDVNRILEPFMLHTAIISSTEWHNFFDLRLATDDKGNPLAYPPIFDLALAIMEAMDEGEFKEGIFTPSWTDSEEIPMAWHLPLIGFEGDEELTLAEKIKVSAARCARVSYLTHAGERNVQEDLNLYKRLTENGHWSPLEHVAHPHPEGSGNFKYWKQLRWYVEQGQF